jgi:hypothetical protein
MTERLRTTAATVEAGNATTVTALEGVDRGEGLSTRLCPGAFLL